MNGTHAHTHVRMHTANDRIVENRPPPSAAELQRKAEMADTGEPPVPPNYNPTTFVSPSAYDNLPPTAFGDKRGHQTRNRDHTQQGSTATTTTFSSPASFPLSGYGSKPVQSFSSFGGGDYSSSSFGSKYGVQGGQSESNYSSGESNQGDYNPGESNQGDYTSGESSQGDYTSGM